MDTALSTTDYALDETCYWVIRPERELWLPEQSEMKIWIEQLEGGSLYLFQGSQRNNVTEALI